MGCLGGGGGAGRGGGGRRGCGEESLRCKDGRGKDGRGGERFRKAVYYIGSGVLASGRNRMVKERERSRCKGEEMAGKGRTEGGN